MTNLFQIPFHYTAFIKVGLLSWLALLGCIDLAFAQQTFTDSLRQLLTTAKEDTNKVKLYNDLAWELKVGEPDQARQYLENSLLLARKLGYRQGEAQACNNRGVVEIIHNDPELAKEYMQKALDIRQDLGDKKGVASLYNNIGNLEDELGNFETAIENLRKSLRLREELKDTLRIARTSYNIAIVYESRGFYPKHWIMRLITWVFQSGWVILLRSLMLKT